MMYAWLSLFEGKPDDAAVSAAQQATLNSNGRKYSSLITLACLNAVRGQTAQAHQQLLEAMANAHLERPDAGIWYGFGEIFEQYGVNAAAVSAYKRSAAVSDTVDSKDLTPGAGSAAILARMRLKELSK